MDSATTQDNGPLAVIDVGVQSARLQISQAEPDGRLTTIETLFQQLPLGLDIYGQGQISAANTRLVGEILRDFVAVMKGNGVLKHKAVVTGAVREATNLEFFLDQVRQISGVHLDVLAESEEIRLIYLAIRAAMWGRIGLSRRNAVICIIGADVCQFLFLKKGQLQNTETVRLGTLRLREELGGPVSVTRLTELTEPFVVAVVNGIARMSAGARPELFLAVGSSVRALVELGSRQPKQSVCSISRRRFHQVAALISGKPPVTLATRYQLQDVIAQSLEPCCTMLEHFFEITAADRLIVPMISTRDALIQDFLRELSGGADIFLPEIISAAENLGEKYSYDATHARTVADLALTLFDALKELHGVGSRGRLLLELGALLHDIGFFLSSRQHHKHSYYIISNSELPGISPEEQEMLALIGRYHRRASPRPAHLEYMALPPERRVLVSKLAALLRVADGLDRAHSRKIREIEVEIKDDRVIIAVRTPDDLTLERFGMQKKADLLQELFGLKVVVENRG